jgi:hypothetical protein
VGFALREAVIPVAVAAEYGLILFVKIRLIRSPGAKRCNT